MYKIKLFFKRLKRVIDFLPIIWKGYDWDYRYAVDLFQYQLSRTANFLDSEKTYSADAKHNAQRLKMIIRLMEKVYEESYTFEGSEKLSEEFGPMNLEWEPQENNTYKLKGFRWEKAVDDAHNKSINEVYSVLLTQGQIKQERAHELLWKLISHNIRKFWD
jgi:hypothetical protein